MGETNNWYPRTVHRNGKLTSTANLFIDSTYRSRSCAPAPGRLASSFRSAWRRSAISPSIGLAKVAARPMTTKSCPPRHSPGRTAPAAAFSRLRTRFRVTALPTFLVTVKPTRTVSSSTAGDTSPDRRHACKTSPRAAHFLPRFATRRNSRRFLSRSIAPAGLSSGGFGKVNGQRQPPSGGEALAPLGTPGGKDPTTGNRCHAVTKSVATLADKLARLIRSFHGTLPPEFARCIRSRLGEVNAAGCLC